MSPGIFQDKQRRFFIPETLQGTIMDNCPAILKSLLEGYGIRVAYGRLREACHTDVDGTTASALSDVLEQVGLETDQDRVPADHVASTDKNLLPCLVPFVSSDGQRHHVIAWRRHGRRIQVMDPMAGRRWMSEPEFNSRLYIETLQEPAEDWRKRAAVNGFCDGLKNRMISLNLDRSFTDQLMQAVTENSQWKPLAALDAVVRLMQSLVRSRSVKPGKNLEKQVKQLFEYSCKESSATAPLVPEIYWTVRPSEALPADCKDSAILKVKNVSLVRISGRRSRHQQEKAVQSGKIQPLSPYLKAALDAPAVKPEVDLFHMLRDDGLLAPGMLIASLAFAVIGFTFEALVLMGLLRFGRQLDVSEYQGLILFTLMSFLMALLFLQIPMNNVMLRIGRRLEIRVRKLFFEKIPNIGDICFKSRTISDMGQRLYRIRRLRDIPSLGYDLLSTAYQIILTAAAIIWIYPQSLIPTIVIVLSTFAFLYLVNPLITEQELRTRTFFTRLNRHILDALKGKRSIKDHSVEETIRMAYEKTLVGWIYSGLSSIRVITMLKGFVLLFLTVYVVWIMFAYIKTGSHFSSILLLLYWVMSIPQLFDSLFQTLVQYPIQRNVLVRLLEVLQIPGEIKSGEKGNTGDTEAPLSPQKNRSGVGIDFTDVTVCIRGHSVLKNINLSIAPGEHVAVVGPSGSGKSILAGLLYGRFPAAEGDVKVDETPLTGETVHLLRLQTAWVDPDVDIFNRSLKSNIIYGERTMQFDDDILEALDLKKVMDCLPQGVDTIAGESGSLLSCGQRQRLRLARAMNRTGVRLAILDEPFQGIDSADSEKYLLLCRKHWQQATVIYISHDITGASNFDRVVVIDSGQIVENDRPCRLLRQSGSRFFSLSARYQAARERIEKAASWRRQVFEDGRLTDKGTEP